VGWFIILFLFPKRKIEIVILSVITFSNKFEILLFLLIIRLIMIIIYTDGSCLSNPGPGGFAFLILKNNTIVDLVCGCVDSNTTNNRAELTAVIEALEWCSTGEYKDEKEIIINTDSQYVQKGMTIWIHNWKRKNWNKVKNPDLWQKLD